MGDVRRQRWAGRARVLEAMALLTVASAAQRWLPMPRWSGVLGDPAPIPSTWADRPAAPLPTVPASLTEHRVATAVHRGAQILPRTPSCLAEAAAAQVMLARRAEPGVVVIGLRRTVGEGPWDSHAWLLGRRGALTGGPAAVGFRPVTVLQRPRGLLADKVDLSPA